MVLNNKCYDTGVTIQELGKFFLSKKFLEHLKLHQNICILFYHLQLWLQSTWSHFLIEQDWKDFQSYAAGKDCKKIKVNNAEQYRAMLNNAEPCQIMQSNAKQYQAMPSNANQYKATPSNAKQRQATPSNANQCQAVPSLPTYCSGLRPVPPIRGAPDAVGDGWPFMLKDSSRSRHPHT